ncbi:MAG: terminase small subunit [Agitococcus sp.]|nr:terminase small subunit [Agitococcus sp.]
MSGSAKKNKYGLTAAWEVFATELASGASQSDAYRKAYPRSLKWNDKSVWDNASKLAANTEVLQRVKDLQEKACKANEITVEKVLDRYWQIATANPNDLMQYRRECCRYCYGENHQYQWIDENEFFHAEEEHHELKDEAERKNSNRKKGQPMLVVDMPPPHDLGGYGFDPSLSPHAKCPKCKGKGNESVFIADTRHLQGGASLLYAGVKVSAQGLEIKTHDQMHALDRVAAYLNMDKKILGGDKENPLSMFLSEISGASVSITKSPSSESDLDDEN